MSSAFYMLYLINDMIFISAYLLFSLVVEEESSYLHCLNFFHSDPVTLHRCLQGNGVQVSLHHMKFSVFLLLFMSFHFISFGHPTGADPHSHFTDSKQQKTKWFTHYPLYYLCFHYIQSTLFSSVGIAFCSIFRGSKQQDKHLLCSKEWRN